MEFLTSAQLRVVRQLGNLEKQNKPAFVTELLKKLPYKSADSGLTDVLKILERKEVIQIYSGGKARAERLIILTDLGRMLLGIGVLPHYGTIPASPPKVVDLSDIKMIRVDKLLNYQPGDFTLDADGDSMIGDHIFHGDTCLIRPNVNIPRGGIAAVKVSDTFTDDYKITLKHVYVEPKKVILKASNRKYDDMEIAIDEWQGVEGGFRGLVRNAN